MDLGFDFYCQQLHCYILNSGFVANVCVSTNYLLRFYKTKESVNDVHKMFVKIPQPNSSSWNSIITAYVNRNWSFSVKCICVILKRMSIYFKKKDEYTYSVLLSGVVGIAALKWRKNVEKKENSP